MLLLREVLGFSAREVAEALDTTVAAVNSSLQRARKTVEDKLPEASQQATLRALGDDRLTAVVQGYMDAMERGDVDAVVDMLVEDATWSMPPLPAWFHGLDSIRAFLIRGPLSGDGAGGTSRPARAGRRRSAATRGTRRRRPSRPSRSTC